ncbi:MAG: M3 family oligoendopeptidase [Erysipelotrichaceae bacterium]
MKTWDLTALYKGYDDPQFGLDFETLESLIANLETASMDVASKTVEEWVTLNETLAVLARKLNCYIYLRLSTNTTDEATNKHLARLQAMMSRTSKPSAVVNKHLANVVKIDALDTDHPTLTHYRYHFNEIIKMSKHLLSDDVEEVVAKLNLSGGSGYESMHDYLTSTLEVDFNGEKTTLSGIRNMAYNADPQVRKEAYLAEVAAYEKIKAPVSFSLNNIKLEVTTMAKLRGYDSVLDMTLENARLSRATLDAMMQAIESHLPKFHEYLRTKAKLLNHENGLPWYDLFAMVGSYQKTFTIEEARDFLLENFKPFAQDLHDMTKRAFDDSWIDFDPKPGKVGGAYCMNLGFIKQSRILTNFDGSFSDVVTLAHELGHAYHGYHIEEHAPLNLDYSMPIAETASTFNENIIMNAVIGSANASDQLSLIESQLQDLTQIICDIYSRYQFESQVFAKRETGFMFDKELCEMMLEAQKKAYGDGLDPNFMHPYMWVCKGHYYSSSLSFYNFPYAFGGLFARGLYAQYRKEGASFVDKYRALLHATTIQDVEDVASICGLDLRDASFWNLALDSICEQIDQFIALSTTIS